MEALPSRVLLGRSARAVGTPASSGLAYDGQNRQARFAGSRLVSRQTHFILE